MVNFTTVFRSVPQFATSPSVGGTVWACTECFDSRIVAMYPHHKWIEILVAVHKTAEYVTSEDGGTTGFGEFDGWVSFPKEMIYQWKDVGSNVWKKGRAYHVYSKDFEAQQKAKKIEELKRKKLYQQNGIDYEAILKAEGLDLIE